LRPVRKGDNVRGPSEWCLKSATATSPLTTSLGTSKALQI